MSNPMVPDQDWGQVARDFAAAQGRQAILCVACVRSAGDTDPPPKIVIYYGETLCLSHLLEKMESE